MEIRFKAFEYTATDDFNIAEYEFEGDSNSGWQILRNNQPYLQLGPGYQILKTRLCGICATDLAIRFLPHPLPQIIGHEVVAQDDQNQKVVVEINDTPYYRDDSNLDIFSREGLYTHTPERLTLGIDRLPGGFGPYILAPNKAIIPIDAINEYCAVLTEPFAAVMQAVSASPPKEGDSLAVLGPRRLGSLLVAGLHVNRKLSKRNYRICALSNHSSLLNISKNLGADNCINLSEVDVNALENSFDIIYDTSGSSTGFELALHLAKNEVHLKSTSGQATCSIHKMTEFVVDELTLLSFTEEHLDFTWDSENRQNLTVYIAPGVRDVHVGNKVVYRGSFADARKILSGREFHNRLPRFDVAIASSPAEIDAIIRPDSKGQESLVRPRGVILFKGDPTNNPILEFVNNGGRVRSSRCGDLNVALKILKEDKVFADNLAFYVISHVFPIHELGKAFQSARDKRSMKVIVKHIEL